MKNKYKDIVERMVLIRKTLSIDYFKAFCKELGVSADFMVSGEWKTNSGG